MLNEVLQYSSEKTIKCLFLDFFGTVVQRNCDPEEIKYLWAKRLAFNLNFLIDENRLLILRKKSEQAVIKRSENGEFNFLELSTEIYSRLISLIPEFKNKYNVEEFYSLSHKIEIGSEYDSQNYIGETIELINICHSNGIRINIISDFYLSKDDIEIFLKKDDIYKKIDNIFVSCDHRISKRNGELYNYACKQLGFSASQCIMVGDNPISDIKNAESFGIKGFLMNTCDGINQRKNIKNKIVSISKKNLKGEGRYTNYCFLLYLYIERLYKILIFEGITDIFFLSREGEFLKKLFDLYLKNRNDKNIRTHYLYVSRKSTYPATLKNLDEEKFDLLRKFKAISVEDFLDNIGMSSALNELNLNKYDTTSPIIDFFNSKEFLELIAREDFQKLYESSRIKYNTLFKKYCLQTGFVSNNIIAIADVGWAGTMQDNICKALNGIDCVGLYVGLVNGAVQNSNSRKKGLVFSETPLDSKDLKIWKYDSAFLERVLWASHDATDHYEVLDDNTVVPVFKNYSSETNNYKLISPLQNEIFKKFDELDNVLIKSCFTCENFYDDFLKIHIRMLFLLNNKQLEFQRKMIDGQMQNFGHIDSAGKTIGTTFSIKRIFKKIWNNLCVLKNCEIIFRILLNYNQKFLIRLMYFFYYQKIKKL